MKGEGGGEGEEDGGRERGRRDKYICLRSVLLSDIISGKNKIRPFSPHP